LQENKSGLFEVLEEEKREITLLKEKVNAICEKHGLEDAELLYLIRKSDDSYYIPVEIFSQQLSPLEAVVNYLKNNKGVKLCKISELLIRDQRTVWTTYQHSLKKQKRLVLPEKSVAVIPISLLSNRKLSILENIAFYLTESKQMKLSEIAILLKKNTSTIWTALSRVKKKLGGKAR
jgi:hypothetical protein